LGRGGTELAAAFSARRPQAGNNSRMLRLIGLVISIGLADSLNPSTIAPALYLASGERPREQVSEFTLAVFAVYFLGGVAIALGPGQLLLALIPHPGRHVAHIAEIVAGVTMLVVAAVLWRHRETLAARKAPELDPHGRSGFVLGATITAVELPTAFPYFAAIAAIVGSGFDPARQVFLLVLFNVCFVLPLLGIAGTLAFGGNQAERLLTVGRNFLERHWPIVLAGLALVAGVFVVLLGVTGIGSRTRGDFGTFSRRFRRFLHIHM
jgi:cytochrome c biogenesis protein CcdA